MENINEKKGHNNVLENGGQSAPQKINGKSLAKLKNELKKAKEEFNETNSNPKRKNGTLKKYKKAIEELEKQIKIKEETPESTANFISMRLHGGVDVVRRKLCRIKNNRPMQQKRVGQFTTLIAEGKYEDSFPIIVTEATELIDKYKLIDYEGNKITEDEAKDFLITLEGQHRCKAFLDRQESGKQVVIPNVWVKTGIEDIGKFLLNINTVGKPWDLRDKLIALALITEVEPFLSIAKLLDEGFNPSTAMIIYTGARIKSPIINKALSGEEYTLNFSIERGRKFVNLCKNAGMKTELIRKRYFIKGFNSYATSIGEEKAFEVLGKLEKLEESANKLKSIREEKDFIKLLNEVENI